MPENMNVPMNEKHLEKVTQGEVRSRPKKRSALADIFIAEDFNSVVSYVLKEVIVPSIKTAIVESFKTGIDRIFYGEESKPSRPIGNPSGASYNTPYYLASSKQQPQQNGTQTRYGSYNDIIFSTRGDAERVLCELHETIRNYRSVSVLDYYDISGVSGGRSTDRRYGWTDLSTATISRLRDGSYIINMPRALPFDD